MSRAGSIGTRRPPSNDEEVVEVDYSIICSTCYMQPDVVRYNVYRRLLFWVCPNDHRDFIEDFEI